VLYEITYRPGTTRPGTPSEPRTEEIVAPDSLPVALVVAAFQQQHSGASVLACTPAEPRPDPSAPEARPLHRIRRFHLEFITPLAMLEQGPRQPSCQIIAVPATDQPEHDARLAQRLLQIQQPGAFIVGQQLLEERTVGAALEAA
jgi:hypothetical protein